MLSMIAKVSNPKSGVVSQFSDRKRRIYKFLSQNPVGVLSSITSAGNPHGVVIYYAVKNDFNLTFLTRVGTLKYDNLSHDNRIALTVFDPNLQATAQICGTATELSDDTIGTVAGDILESTLRTGAGGLPPMSKQELGNYVAFTIQPSQIRMAYFAKPDSGVYGKVFESVESFDLNED